MDALMTLLPRRLMAATSEVIAVTGYPSPMG
jgi:hypothetical protein